MMSWLKGSWLSWRPPLTREGRIYPERWFEMELEREMLRAERGHQALTLVLMGVGPAELSACERREGLAWLACAASAACRRIDLVGWHAGAQGRRVGVILPHTPPEASLRLVEEMGRRFRELMRLRLGERARLPEPLIEIYGYPCDGRLGGDDDRQLRLFEDEDLLAQPTAAPEPGPGRTAYPRLRALGSLRGAPRWKRVMDIALTLTALVLLAPLLLLIGLAIRLNSPGPVFYRQQRIGLGGRPFMLWKFRSMTTDADGHAALHREYLRGLLRQSANLRDQPMVKLDQLERRVTAVGRLLRATSLDELPQLINVLRGEMSLVGPRPCLPYEAEDYLPWCWRRFDVLPGLTGLWQVSGKNRLGFRQMIRLDIRYARGLSPLSDLWIIARTIPTILGDAHQILQPRKGKSYVREA